MSETFAGGDESLTWYSALSSDELKSYYDDYREEYASNQLRAENTGLNSRWGKLYNYIYRANAVLEGIQLGTGLSETAKIQLEGEARFIRAFMYFHLVNFWGDIPLAITTNYRDNSRLPRAPVSQVYQLIIEDLVKAQSLLQEEDAGQGRTRPNKAAATALLARVYLYKGEWAKAEQAATYLIDLGSYTLEDSLNAVFQNSSRETIWQLQSVIPFLNTWDGYYFILQRAPTGVSLPETFVEEAFEPGDRRKTNWVGTYQSGGDLFYFPYKYKVRASSSADVPAQEYPIFFRLAEQYLIRAEARANQNNFPGAIEDINKIRTRAGLNPIDLSSSQITLSALLLAIEQERKAELFTEWCHRWFDLKRTGRADEVLGKIKPGWQSTDILYPLPQLEMGRNSNLIPQNAGY